MLTGALASVTDIVNYIHGVSLVLMKRHLPCFERFNYEDLNAQQLDIAYLTFVQNHLKDFDEVSELIQYVEVVHTDCMPV